MLKFRFINPIILIVSCLILSVSGCQAVTKSKTNAPPTRGTQNRSPLRLPFPFLPGSSSPTPAEPSPVPRPYEEPQRTPPPPAPAVSWMDRLMLRRGTNRPSKSMNPNRKGVFNNKVTTRPEERQQNLRSYQLQNIFQPKAIQQVEKTRFGNHYPQHVSASEFRNHPSITQYELIKPGSQFISDDHQSQPLYQQPVVLGFDSNVQMFKHFETQGTARPNPSLYGQQYEVQANKPTSNYPGIDQWSQANWRSPSLVSDWNRQRPRQMTPSNKILPVMSVPQDATSDDVEKWPHHEVKIKSSNRFEEIPPPVFDEDKQHVILIKPRQKN